MWKQFDAVLQLPTCSYQAAKDYNDFSTLIKLMQFLMGLDDVYQPVRTNLLTREPLPSVKVAFSVVSREESHRNASTGTKNQNVSFVSNANQSVEQKKKVFRGPNPNLKCTHCNMLGHTVDRCFELVGYPPEFKKKSGGQVGKYFSNNKSNVSSVPSVSPFSSEQVAKLLSLVGEKTSSDPQSSNMGGESSYVFNSLGSFVCCSSLINFGFDYNWIVDSGANQHMVKTDKDMFDCIDVSEYDLTVSHPNGTKAKVSKTGSIKLANWVIRNDVFFVPDYSVNILSVNKLSKDSKITVVFNENTCLLPDSKSGRILVTGKQDNGLYFVNKDGNSVNLCFNSLNNGDLWHNRLGHPADQILSILKGELGVADVVKHPCETCHRAKQVRVPFPLSEHKTKNVGDIIHLDVWGPYKVTSRDGFKYFLTVVDDYSRTVCIETLTTNPISPNDEEGSHESHEVTGDDQQPIPSTSATSSNVEHQHSRIGDESSSSEGSGRAEDTSTSNDEINPSEGTSSTLRRSNRNVVLPKRFENFVLNSMVKYSLDKVVNYSCLSVDNLCFTTSLNKTTEPSSYEEVANDPRWVEVMNKEMEALGLNISLVEK
ncbi:uncharacterized protein LOC110888738 [Helianthus annuus]|uniref:uncharacterized protein LOC110888738 n=1 Tax=Helianthus annuus TaxID=4232 RepID=UPI001652F83E|nr:uncharacterized protein LOC110888738 [Helianthus annuus]